MSLKLLEEFIAPYKPLKDINTMIVEINKIFHSYDAINYDNEHPEIFDQLPEIYKQMCNLLPTDKKLKVLDFGCGTGFEALQLLNNLKNIEILCCYDISDEMLAICEQKLNKDGYLFVNNIDKIPKDIKFNVLVTNSLLHHLPQPLETIADLEKFISDDCYYIMGHEGSVRFFMNDDIMEAQKNFCKEHSPITKNLRRVMNIKKYPYYFKTILNINKNPYHLTAIRTV